MRACIVHALGTAIVTC